MGQSERTSERERVRGRMKGREGEQGRGGAGYKRVVRKRETLKEELEILKRQSKRTRNTGQEERKRLREEIGEQR